MWLRTAAHLTTLSGVWFFVLLNRWDIAQRSVQRTLTPCMSVQFALSQAYADMVEQADTTDLKSGAKA